MDSGNRYNVHAQTSIPPSSCLRPASNQFSNSLEWLELRRLPSLGFGLRHGCGVFLFSGVVWPVAANGRESEFDVFTVEV